MKTKQTEIVKSEVIKSGVGKRGPWTLIKVIDSDKVSYTTFDKDVLGRSGEAEITYEEKTNGQFVNRELKAVNWVVNVGTNLDKASDDMLGKLSATISKMDTTLKEMQVVLDKVANAVLQDPFQE